MRLFLSRLLATITQKPRYFPTIEWSSVSWTHNTFRAFEYLFGREYGIRRESRVSTDNQDGKMVVSYRFYTAEAFLAHTEAAIRHLFSKTKQQFEWVQVPQFRLINAGTTQNPIKVPAFVFSIAFDASSGPANPAPATSVTLSHTCTGTDRVLTVGVNINDAADTLSGDTYNGTTMTEVPIGSTNIPSGPRRQRAYLHYLVNPPTGAHDIVATASGSCSNAFVVTAHSYTGVDQTTPCNISSKGETSSNVTSISATGTTTVDDCWAVSIGDGYQGFDTSGTNNTLRTGTMGDSNGSVGTAGSKTTSGGYSGTAGPMAIVSIFIAPAAGGASVNSGFFQFM